MAAIVQLDAEGDISSRLHVDRPSEIKTLLEYDGSRS